MIEVGDEIYYARTLKSTNVYETLALTVATIYSTYFVAVDSSNQRFIFDFDDIDEIIFKNKQQANGVVMNAKTSRVQN